MKPSPAAPKYRAIFWDNDGVLVDTERLFFEANRQILAEVGIALDWPTFVEVSLRRGERLLALADKVIPSGGHQTLLQRRNQRYCEILDRTEAAQLLRPGIIDLLKSLHGKLIMGIVSSCRREHFELMHRKTDLLPLMDFTINMEDCPVTKPDAYPYLLALKRAGVAAPEAAAIEDAERGVTSARQAGLDVFVLSGGIETGEDFSAATGITRNLEQLRQWIYPAFF